MVPMLEYIKNQILVFDGGMGRELQKKGLPDDVPPELWNLEKPEIIQQLHREYFEAGAVAVTTNTFGGNRIKLSQYGLESKVSQINQMGVK